MIRLILLVAFILFVLALTFLPWWVNLIIGVVVILLGKFMAGRALLWLVSIPFRAKGKVLHDAVVEVHSVRPAAAPAASTEDADEDESPAVPRDYYELDVTIKPHAPTGPFMFWDYGEVTLVIPDKRWDKEDDSCRVASVDLVRDGTPAPALVKAATNGDEEDSEDEDEGGSKVPGPQRLKMLIGVKPGVRDLVFNYYFEKFGMLKLPVVEAARLK